MEIGLDQERAVREGEIRRDKSETAGDREESGVLGGGEGNEWNVDGEKKENYHPVTAGEGGITWKSEDGPLV